MGVIQCVCLTKMVNSRYGLVPVRPELVYIMFGRSVTRPGLGDVVVVVAHVAVVVAQTQPGPAILQIIFYYDTLTFI